MRPVDDDKVKDWKMAAQQALGEERFEDFFRNLPKVHDFESYQLLYDALQIAKRRKNATALNLFTTLSLNGLTSHHQELLFSRLIEAWVEIGEIEKAVSLVVLYDNDAIPPGSRWGTLGYSLLQKFAFKSLKNVYPYLKPQQLLCQRVVSSCLQSRAVQQTWSDWLFWLKEFGELSHNQQELEAILDHIADDWLSDSDVTTMCELLRSTAAAPLIDQLWIRLIERCIVNRLSQTLQSLTAVLPVKLQWLTSIQQPFTTTGAFTLLQHLLRRLLPHLIGIFFWNVDAECWKKKIVTAPSFF
jgi:hypothetical protein